MKDSQSQPWLRNIVLGMEENRVLVRRANPGALTSDWKRF
jgi:hypothetical protein